MRMDRKKVVRLSRLAKNTRVELIDAFSLVSSAERSIIAGMMGCAYIYIRNTSAIVARASLDVGINAFTLLSDGGVADFRRFSLSARVSKAALSSCRLDCQ